MSKLIIGFLLSFLFLNIVFILITIFKRVRTQEKPNIFSVRDLNFNLVQAIFYVVAFIIVFIIFLKWYFNAYEIMVPYYYSNWYDLFDYNSLVIIKDIFLQTNKAAGLNIMVSYLGVGFGSFYLSILFFTISIIQLYKGVPRKAISKEGIRCSYKTIKWSEIVEYEWQDSIVKSKVSKNSENYKLNLYLNNGKFGKWISREDTEKFTLKISSQDKEKVDDLVNSMNVKLRSNDEAISI